MKQSPAYHVCYEVWSQGEGGSRLSGHGAYDLLSEAITRAEGLREAKAKGFPNPDPRTYHVVMREMLTRELAV